MQISEVSALVTLLSGGVNQAGDPLNSLKQATLQDPLDILNSFKDVNTLRESLKSTWGSLARAFWAKPGYLLDDDYNLVKSPQGGFYSNGDTMNGWLGVISLMVYTAMIGATSGKGIPKNVQGKVFQSPSNVSVKLDLANHALLMKTFSLPEAEYLGLTNSKGLRANDADPNISLEKVTKQILLKLRDLAPDDYFPVPLWVYEAIGGESYANAVCLSPLYGGVPTLDVSAEFVNTVLTILKNFVNSKSHDPKLLVDSKDPDDPDTTVWTFDRGITYEVNAEGVTREGLSVQGMLISNHQLELEYDPAKAHELTANHIHPCDLSYLNGSGAFMICLLDNLKSLGEEYDRVIGANCIPLGAWESRYMRTVLPLDRESEQGCYVHGSRRYYNSRLAQAYKVTNRFINFFQRELGKDANGVKHYQKTVFVSHFGLSTDIHPSLIAPIAFTKFNQFLSPKSMTFMDGRLIGLKLANVPQEYQAEVLTEWMKVPKVNPNLFNAEFHAEIVYFMSTKIAKIATRILLNLANSPQKLINGVQLSYVPESQYTDPNHGIDVAFRVPTIIGNTLINAPGCASQLGEIGVFLVQTSIFERFEEWIRDPESQNVPESTLKVQIGGEYTSKVKGKKTILTFVSEGAFIHQTRYDYVELVNYPTWSKKLNKMILEPLLGHYVLAGTEILTIAYADGYHSLTAPEDCLVTEISYQTNSFGSLEVTVVYEYAVSELKGRGVAKAMYSKPINSDYLYNPLNPNVPTGVKVVLTSDTLKHKDLRIGLLPYAASTFLVNAPQLIQALNAAIGHPDVDDILIVSDLGLTLGLYDPLCEAYVDRYGQAIWVHHLDVADGIHRVNCESYLNEAIDLAHYREGDYWVLRSVEDLAGLNEDVRMATPIPLGTFPSSSKIITSCSTDNPHVISAMDDIFVFYSTIAEELPLNLWQRGWSYGSIVNELGQIEHTWADLKPELSDMPSNVGRSSVMQSIVRVTSYDNGVTPALPQVTADLNIGWRERVDKLISLLGVMAGLSLVKDGVTYPVISVFNETLTDLSDEFMYYTATNAMIVELTKGKITLKTLSDCYNSVILHFKTNAVDFKLFLPAIVAQDPHGLSSDSLSGLILDIFRTLLVDVSFTVKQRLYQLRNRLQGHTTLSPALEGNSILKQVSHGRPGVTAKVLGVSGLPVNTVVVAYSQNPKSSYQYLLKETIAQGHTKDDLLAGELWREKESDVLVLRGRTPLLFVNYLRVVAIMPNYVCPKTGLRLGESFNCPWVFYVNPAVALIDAGDFDGDGNLFIVLSKGLRVPLTTLEDCTQAILLRTGIEATHRSQENYNKDHYFPKKDIGVSCYKSAKNLQLIYSSLKDDKSEILDVYDDKNHSIVANLVKGGITQTYLVGSAYQYFMTVETWVGLKATVPVLAKCFPWLVSQLTFPAGEIYEAGTLGGYDPKCYHIVSILQAIMQGKSTIEQALNGQKPESDVPQIKQSDFAELLEDSPLNKGYASQFLLGADMLQRGLKLGLKLGKMKPDLAIKENLTPEEALVITGLLNFFVTKGQMWSEGYDSKSRILKGLYVGYLNVCRRYNFAEVDNSVIQLLNYLVPSLLKVSHDEFTKSPIILDPNSFKPYGEIKRD